MSLLPGSAHSSSPSPPFVDFKPLDLTVASSVRYGRREFPARSDYESAYAELGVASELVWDDPARVAATMRHWHTLGQTGCLFARQLARLANSERWATAVIPGTDPDELRKRTTTTVSGAIAAGISDPGCEIVSLVYPDATSVAHLKAIVGSLAQGTAITSSEDRSQDGTTIVALRLDVTGDGCLAWIMAFGPFGPFAAWPATRRGPLLELAIRTKPKPGDLFHKLNQDASAAHLADSSLPFSTDQMERIFERTEKTTRDVLGHAPDFRSAAKATFSFPSTEWDAAAAV